MLFESVSEFVNYLKNELLNVKFERFGAIILVKRSGCMQEKLEEVE